LNYQISSASVADTLLHVNLHMVYTVVTLSKCNVWFKKLPSSPKKLLLFVTAGLTQ